MASGTITLNESASSGGRLAAKIEWSAAADTASNASRNVTANIYVRKYDPSQTLTIPTTGTWSFNLSINGNSITGTKYGSVLSDWVLIGTHTVSSIGHNSDGSKSITISGSVSAPSGTGFAGHTSSGSGTAMFDTIPRASTISSAPDVTLGGFSSVRWYPRSSAFRYKLKYTMGNWSLWTGVIHPNTTLAYIIMTIIPLEAAYQIPNSKTGEMTVTLYTYSDSAGTVQVGTEDSEVFTVTVPDNGDTQPDVSMSLSPVSSLPSAFAGLYIQGKTKIKAALSATGKYGASIKAYSMNVDGSSYGSANGYTSGYLTNVGSRTVYGYATDNREHTGSASQVITVIAYSPPKIQNVVAARCDSNGNFSETGTYLKIIAKRSYDKVLSGSVQKNFCQIRFRYKAATAASYGAWVTILAANNLSSDEVITGPLLAGALKIDTTYLLEVQAIDDIGEYANTIISIPTETVYMHKTKNAMGLGKYAEGENLLDVGWDAHFRGEVKIGEIGMTLKEYILTVVNGGG